MNTSNRRQRRATSARGIHARPAFRVWLMASALMLTALACACDIPVYEYTLQNWLRDAYQVSYFYSGTEDARDVPVNMYLQRAAEGGAFHANLSIRKINVSGGEAARDRAGMDDIPARHRSRRLPFHTVITPRGTEFFAGRLDLADAKTLVQSPQRKWLARELCQGKNGLLLVLLGADQAQNAIAKKTVRRVIADAAKEDVDVGMLHVRRDAAEEKWFVRQLLSIEDDLRQLDDTMVFGVFGRGHVMEPYLGKGITEQNIKAIVSFMIGPCACEIKTSSAGMDMLTSWDWDRGIAGHAPAQERPMHSALFDVAEDKASPVTPQRSTTAPPSAKQDTHQDAQAGPTGAAGPGRTSAAAATGQSRTQPAAHARLDSQEEPPQQTGTGAIPPAMATPATVPPDAQREGKPTPPNVEQRPDAMAHASPDEGVAVGGGPGLTKLLSVRLGAILAAGTVLLLAASLAIVWKRRRQ